MFPLSFLTKGELKELRKILIICVSIAILGCAALSMEWLKTLRSKIEQKKEVPVTREARLMSLYRAAGHKFDIPWEYLKAINKVETEFGKNTGRYRVLDVLAKKQHKDFYMICSESGIDPNSVRGSRAGAVGFMQFMPSTWHIYKDASGNPPYSPWDAEDAVFAAARLLAEHHGREEMNRALWNYNPDPDYVSEVTQLASAYSKEEKWEARDSSRSDTADRGSKVTMAGSDITASVGTRDLADEPDLKLSELGINWWFDKQVEFEDMSESMGPGHTDLMLLSVFTIDKFQNRTTDYIQNSLKPIGN